MAKAVGIIQVTALLLGTLTSSCASRVQTGAIEGQVSGASGSFIQQGVLGSEFKVLAIPNANVTIKNASTRFVRSAQADFKGRFKVGGIPPGHYELSFFATPFNSHSYAVDVRPGGTVDASTQMLTRMGISISGCPASLIGGTAPSDLGTVEIRMKRTGCYGPCPVFSVRIQGDGEVEYQGYRFVAALGIRKYRVSPSNVAALVRKSFEGGFFNFCNSYEELVTDMSTVETTIRLGSVAKTVSAYGTAVPEGLEDLDAQIEAVANVGQLVKSPYRPN